MLNIAGKTIQPMNLAILKLIQSEEIDMVIMTSQGSSAHFDFGGVVDRVIKCTSTPTVIVPV